MKKLLIITMVVISIVSLLISCKPAESSGPVKPTLTLPADSKFLYDPNVKEYNQYGTFFNEHWSSKEVELLEKIPGGISVDTREHSLLLKLLVKQLQAEEQLDLYLNHQDTSELPYVEFTFDRMNEGEVRNARWLSPYFDQEERELLSSLPLGLSVDMNNTEALLAKCLVKSTTVDKKLQQVMTAPTLHINPKEFIRQYLKEHPEVMSTNTGTHESIESTTNRTR